MSIVLWFHFALRLSYSWGWWRPGYTLKWEGEGRWEKRGGYGGGGEICHKEGRAKEIYHCFSFLLPKKCEVWILISEGIMYLCYVSVVVLMLSEDEAKSQLQMLSWEIWTTRWPYLCIHDEKPPWEGSCCW